MDTVDRPAHRSAQRAMEILGERWTILILHEAFWGVRRFSEFQRNLGIARNILSARLQSLTAAGVLARSRYQEEPERFEYRLTPMGRDLYPAVIAIISWGDEHLAEDDRPPLVLRHTCGSNADPRLVCSCCGEELDPRKVAPEPAPGSATRVA